MSVDYFFMFHVKHFTNLKKIIKMNTNDTSQLQALANQIKNETAQGANTAQRVGSAFQYALNALIAAQLQNDTSITTNAGNTQVSSAINELQNQINAIDFSPLPNDNDFSRINGEIENQPLTIDNSTFYNFIIDVSNSQSSTPPDQYIFSSQIDTSKIYRIVFANCDYTMRNFVFYDNQNNLIGSFSGMVRAGDEFTLTPESETQLIIKQQSGNVQATDPLSIDIGSGGRIVKLNANRLIAASDSSITLDTSSYPIKIKANVSTQGQANSWQNETVLKSRIQGSQNFQDGIIYFMLVDLIDNGQIDFWEILNPFGHTSGSYACTMYRIDALSNSKTLYRFKGFSGGGFSSNSKKILSLTSGVQIIPNSLYYLGITFTGGNRGTYAAQLVNNGWGQPSNGWLIPTYFQYNGNNLAGGALSLPTQFDLDDPNISNQFPANNNQIHPYVRFGYM